MVKVYSLFEKLKKSTECCGEGCQVHGANWNGDSGGSGGMASYM
jgi:hypothetical protein